MADLQAADQPRRVKVYQMRDEKWIDLGTGYCVGHLEQPETIEEEAYILVRSEENENTVLLRSQVTRDTIYQKQQETLIVWKELDGADVAVSFQEAEGCSALWSFLARYQAYLVSIMGPDDLLSDDREAAFLSSICLPEPSLMNLVDVDLIVREASCSVAGKEALAKLILNENYLAKLVALLETAESLHRLDDLHRLCNIVKFFVFLNDQAIFEYAMRDDIVLGIAGILEYDPDFPDYKANHRQYLSDERKFRQVVPIEHPETQKKIHETFRLQYFRDVVLARFIDDATYGIFHSLILYNQIDIIQHLQNDSQYMQSIFKIFQLDDEEKKEEATYFIAQFCAVIKQFQQTSRTAPLVNLVSHGLFDVFDYALIHASSAIRLAIMDVFMLLVENDPKLIRCTILKRLDEQPSHKPILETLIGLIHTSVDLGLKAQVTEALRIVLDPLAGPITDSYGKTAEQILRLRQGDSESEKFLNHFYEKHVENLFLPFSWLEKTECTNQMNRISMALYTHLCDLLCYMVRMHSFRSKYFVLTKNISSKVAKLFSWRERYLQLTALRYFRTIVGLNDEFYLRHLVRFQLFAPIMTLLLENGPCSNLLNSACLEFFEYIRNEDLTIVLEHLVEHYRESMATINYVDTFQQILAPYEPASQTANTRWASLSSDNEGETVELIETVQPLVDYDSDPESPTVGEKRRVPADGEASPARKRKSLDRRQSTTPVAVELS